MLSASDAFSAWGISWAWCCVCFMTWYGSLLQVLFQSLWCCVMLCICGSFWSPSACCTQASLHLFWTWLLLAAPSLCIGGDNELYLSPPCHLGFCRCCILFCHAQPVCFGGFLHLMQWGHTVSVFLKLTAAFQCLHTGWLLQVLSESRKQTCAALYPCSMWLWSFSHCFPAVLSICLAGRAQVENIPLCWLRALNLCHESGANCSRSYCHKAHKQGLFG